MANIGVTLYDGSLEVNFDCSGAIKCDFALWEFMPIDNDESCAFRYCGSCRNAESQLKALERIKRRLSKKVKSLKEEIEEGY